MKHLIDKLLKSIIDKIPEQDFIELCKEKTYKKITENINNKFDLNLNKSKYFLIGQRMDELNLSLNIEQNKDIKKQIINTQNIKQSKAKISKIYTMDLKEFEKIKDCTTFSQIFSCFDLAPDSKSKKLIIKRAQENNIPLPKDYKQNRKDWERKKQLLKIDHDKLIELSKEFTLWRILLNKLNINHYYKNIETVKTYMVNNNIDASKIFNSKQDLLNNKDYCKRYYLTNNIQYTANIKSIIFKFKKEQCEECKITNIYNNKLIVLQIHHIDGNNKNNTLENLQVLCPNCHSQTENYARIKDLKK